MGLLERLEQDEELKREEAERKFLQLDVDIIQTENGITVVAPVPGVSAEDLDIDFEDEEDVVTIHGKRKISFPEELEEECEYLRQECDWNNFYRQIILPQKIDPTRAQARFKKGILFLVLPF